MEIPADHEGGEIEPALQHLLDENLRRQRSEFGVEGQRDDAGEPAFGERRRLLREGREAEDDRTAGEEIGRMRLEGQRRARRAGATPRVRGRAPARPGARDARRRNCQWRRRRGASAGGGAAGSTETTKDECKGCPFRRRETLPKRAIWPDGATWPKRGRRVKPRRLARPACAVLKREGCEEEGTWPPDFSATSRRFAMKARRARTPWLIAITTPPAS